MKFLVIGAGGVGGFFGGMLARANFDVTFVTRGNHAQEIKDNGLKIKTLSEEFTVVPKVVTSPETELTTDFDFIIHSTKSLDLETALLQIRHIIKPTSTVIFTQNGIDNYERISKLIPKNQILAASIQIVSEISSAGVITQKSQIKKFTFGEVDGKKSERCATLSNVFRSAKIEFELSADINVELWSKFIFINAFSGVTSFAQLPIGAVMSDPKLSTMYQECLKETHDLAIQMGIQLPENILIDKFNFSKSMNPKLTSSMQRDFAKGNATELESLNGAVCNLGRKLKLAVPVNDLIYKLLSEGTKKKSG